MSFRSALIAASVLVAATNAHITISKPVPFSADVVKTDKGAITAEQYPCKSHLGFTVTTLNKMAVGEAQQLEFDGSAVHGGGSCQLSYTTDTVPTKDSVFKVIKSIEGGCPGVDGTKSYEYTLPEAIPNGKGTFAWSWFAKSSGAPEFYMNCAPIEVTGGASDASGLDALPDMQIANIASTTCKSPQNFAMKFPNPGENLEDGGTGDVKDPTGDCGSKASTPTTPQEPTSSSAAQASAPASSSQPVISASAAPSATGGAFAPGAPSTMATMATSAPVASQAPTASTTPSTGGTGACAQNGAIVCNGTTQFGICNGGNVIWQPVAPGTTCNNGVIQKRTYNGRIARRV